MGGTNSTDKPKRAHLQKEFDKKATVAEAPADSHPEGTTPLMAPPGHMYTKSLTSKRQFQRPLKFLLGRGGDLADDPI